MPTSLILASTATSGALTLIIPVGFLLIVLMVAWAISRRSS
jgi:hypothetical protein